MKHQNQNVMELNHFQLIYINHMPIDQIAWHHQLKMLVLKHVQLMTKNIWLMEELKQFHIQLLDTTVTHMVLLLKHSMFFLNANLEQRLVQNVLVLHSRQNYTSHIPTQDTAWTHHFFQILKHAQSMTKNNWLMEELQQFHIQQQDTIVIHLVYSVKHIAQRMTQQKFNKKCQIH